MDMLQNMLSGQNRQQADDFVSRYDQGAPWDGIDDNEAMDQYRRVAPNLSDDDYEDSARQAFSRLDPQQRQELGQYMAQQARQRNIQVDDDSETDPEALTELTYMLREELLELDVDEVELVAGGDAPPGRAVERSGVLPAAL